MKKVKQHTSLVSDRKETQQELLLRQKAQEKINKKYAQCGLEKARADERKSFADALKSIRITKTPNGTRSGTMSLS